MKKIKLRSKCSKTGHTYPIIGETEDGRPVHDITCSWCHRPNKSRLSRLMASGRIKTKKEDLKDESKET